MLNRRSLRLALFVILLVLSLLFASTPFHKAVAQDGQILADTGFKPDQDGFGFRNYGAKAPYTNLTPVDVRRLFGDQVCAELNGDTCVLTPAGDEWMNNVNQKIGGGHCDGMATLSELMYLKQANTSDFGADKTVNLDIATNEKLQREIAYWWTTQITEPTVDQKIANITALANPSDLLKKFIDDTKTGAETYTVYLAQPNYKHAHVVTPYAVQDRGNGLYWLMVYDNNFPKQARHIEIDTNAETWQYSTAADPAQSESDYAGDATTKTLTLVPNSPRLQPQLCPFCQAASSKASGFALPAGQYNQVWLNDSESATSNIHLLITDGQGNKLGYDNGTLVNQIPGARFDIVGNQENLWQDEVEPLYEIPVGVPFTITLDGSVLTTPETSSMSMIGPGYDLAVDNIQVQPGESDLMTVSPDGKLLTYKPSGAESPDFSVGTAHSDADYTFGIKGFEVDKGATVHIDLEYDKGQLSLHTEGNTNPSTYALTITRMTRTDEQTFTHDGIPLDVGATAYLDFGKWNGKGDLNIEVDSKSDGTIDQTLDEPSQK